LCATAAPGCFSPATPAVLLLLAEISLFSFICHRDRDSKQATQWAVNALSPKAVAVAASADGGKE